MSNNNVVVFGESGSGKSSLVNLVLGAKRARVSDSATGCTFQFQRYPHENFNFYDTVGLNEGSRGAQTHAFAVKQLINLLRSLEDGVSLLIFVVKLGRITDRLVDNYKLFVEAICMRQVPVILVITHSEMEKKKGKWWEENKRHFDNYGMTFRTVISGCCMSPENAPALMDKEGLRNLNKLTFAQLHRAIHFYTLNPGWKISGGWKSWVKNVVSRTSKIFCQFFGIPWKGGNPQDFQSRLKNYFIEKGYESQLAKKMASDIANSV